MRRVGTVNAMQGSGVTSGCSTCMLIAPRWLGSYEDNAEKVRSVGDSCAVCGRSINEVGTSGRRSDSFHLIFSTVCNCRCHNASRCRCGRRYQRCPFHAKVLTRTRPLRPCHHAGNAWSPRLPPWLAHTAATSIRHSPLASATTRPVPSVPSVSVPLTPHVHPDTVVDNVDNVDRSHSRRSRR
jgi:hypothetical protein